MDMKIAYGNFRRERLRLDREVLNLMFLKKCKRQNVIPKFLTLNYVYALQIIPRLKKTFELKCLNAYIRDKYAYLDVLSKRVYSYYLQLVDKPPPPHSTSTF